MGNVFHEQGRLEEAIEAYKKALAINPDYAEAYSNLGVSLHDQGELEEAIEAYNKALAINPDYAEAHYHRSFALLNTHKFMKALKNMNGYGKQKGLLKCSAIFYCPFGMGKQAQR